jgi:hypothetical protein
MEVPLWEGWLPGDCLYEAVIKLFPERLPRTAGELREGLAGRLADDFARADRAEPDDPARYAHHFPGTVAGPEVTQQQADQRRRRVLEVIRAPGEWDNDDADNTAMALADAYGLRMVVLAPERPYDAGPDGSREAYALYTGDHYTAATARAGRRVLPEAELYMTPEQAARLWAGEAPADRGELAGNLDAYRSGFAELQAILMALIPVLTPEDADRGFGLIDSFEQLLAELAQREGSLDGLDRAGALYARFRQLVESPDTAAPQETVAPASPGPLTLRLGDQQGALTRRVIEFLQEPAAPAIAGSVRNVHDQLTAVLAEATGEAGDRPRSEEWNSLVSNGLALLPPAPGGSSYVALPGIDHRNLSIGDQFTVPGLIHARAVESSVADAVRYEIVSPHRRDVSRLVGGSDLVMLDRGQRFEVTAVVSDGPDRLLIRLEHPG